MTLTELGWMALQIAAPVLVAAATYAAAKLASFIASKVHNEYLSGALTRLDDAVLTAVKELEQTVVGELKLASADGRIDATERVRIKDAAVTNVKSYLGPKGLAVIARVFGLTTATLEPFLESRVEATVHDLRADERAAATASVVVTSPPAATAATPDFAPAT